MTSLANQRTSTTLNEADTHGTATDKPALGTHSRFGIGDLVYDGVENAGNGKRTITGSAINTPSRNSVARETSPAARC